MLITDSKRVEIRITLPQCAIIDRTVNAISKWKERRHSERLSASMNSADPIGLKLSNREATPRLGTNASRFPMEIYEQILEAVGNDIQLLPSQLLKSPGHYLSYFQSVDRKVRARKQTLRNCRLVSSAWNEIALKHLNTYLVLRNESWKDHAIWRTETSRRQIRHVWIIPSSFHEDRMPWRGLFAMVFTGFPNLETLYASFPSCYDTFYSEQFLRLHVPPNLRILGLDGPALRARPANPIRGQLQLHVLRLFPKLE